MTGALIVALAALVVAVVTYAQSRRNARQLAQVTEMYWQLKLDHGELKAKLDPATPVTYYSRGTGPAHWDALTGLPIQCLGIDWNHDIGEVLTRYGERWSIQGNVDPQWLHLPGDELERRLRAYFGALKALPPERRRGWICGLGHGVLQRTPEANVLRFIALQREIFG